MEILERITQWISVWETLPVVSFFTIILCVVINKYKKNEKIAPLKEFSNKKKFDRIKNIYSRVDYVVEIYLFVGITLALFPLVALFNKKCYLYIYQVMIKIDAVCSIVIGLTGIVVTMAVVIVVFDKRYYVFFSIREVLQRYKFSEWLLVVIFSCALVSGLTISLFNVNEISYFYLIRFMFLEIGVIYNIVSATYLLCVIVNIMFFDQKRELCLLRQLYRRFWLYKIDTSYFKSKNNYTADAVRINLEYLIDNYIKVGNKKKIAKIRYIEFATTIGIYKNKWFGIARRKFIRTVYFLLILSTIANILCGNNKLINTVNIIVTLLMIGVTYLKKEAFQLVIIRICSDTWGYYIEAEKELLVPRSVFINNVYSEYIKSMNSLNAFFYIWLNDIGIDQMHMLDMFESVIAGVKNMRVKNMVSYFPVFTIGYFVFENGIQCDVLKKIYSEIILKEDDLIQFRKMMHSQIFYLTSSINDNIFEYEEKLNAYLEWIEH